MKETKLLDCTLRDGGYLNDWEFGHNNIVSIFERLADAGIDIIEIGFLDEHRNFDMNRTIMPSTDSADRIYQGLDKKESMVVGMIDYGTCSLDYIKPCKDSFIDGIRVIFKKHLREEALEYCGELKKLGYNVFAQLVSVTSYEEDEMLDLIQLANKVEPFAVSMVDTYGLMHQNNLKHYFEMLNRNLKPEISIGYHAHNNFQMGYANCIEMLAQKSERTILVDGSIYGMGKSAGNAPLELVAMHMNHCYEKNYHISQILEAIDVNIMNFYKPATWGYNMFYYMAASNDCHPDYVSYLMDRRTLSIKSINEILGKLTGDKKLLYDKNYIEKLYFDYQNIDVDDTESINRLTEELKYKNILILGPGTNVEKQKEKIDSYIKENNPVIISINFMPESFSPNYIFLSNSKRYLQMATFLSRGNCDFKVISTSNVTKTIGKFDYTLKYASLLEMDTEIIDNSFIMFLKVMVKLGAKSVCLGGFDGYISEENSNYINPNMEYRFNKAQAESLNLHVIDVINKLKDKLDVSFITDSLYAVEKGGD